MPKREVPIVTDDLDGKELPGDTQPVHLSMGRTTYALYLSEANHGKLMDALDPFISDAETVAATSTPRKAAASANNGSDEDRKAARHWAIDTGFEYENAAGEKKKLGDRGRIPDSVMQAWKDAGSPAIGA